METSRLRKRMPVTALTDPKIVVPAIDSAFASSIRAHGEEPGDVRHRSCRCADHCHLHPRHGYNGASSRLPSRSPPGCGSRCCSPISPRPSPKGAARRKPRLCAHAHDTRAKRYIDEKTGVSVRRSRQASPGHVVLVEANEVIPGDGEILEGVASVNESAITGESAPVIREAGGDRRPSPAERPCCPTSSRYGSPPRRARPSSTG